MCWDADQIHPDRTTCSVMNGGVSWERKCLLPAKGFRSDMLVFLIIGWLEFSGKESESRKYNLNVNECLGICRGSGVGILMWQCFLTLRELPWEVKV